MNDDELRALNAIAMRTTGKRFTELDRVDIPINDVEASLYATLSERPKDPKKNIHPMLMPSLRVVVLDWAETGTVPELSPDMISVLHASLVLTLTKVMLEELLDVKVITFPALPRIEDQTLALFAVEALGNPLHHQQLLEQSGGKQPTPLRRLI